MTTVSIGNEDKPTFIIASSRQPLQIYPFVLNSGLCMTAYALMESVFAHRLNVLGGQGQVMLTLCPHARYRC